MKNLEKYNKKLMPYPLKFKKSDIELVFVKHDYEIQEISKEFLINPEKIKVSTWKT